jgi:predicted metallo-beta-lactamase superfamily hydrolase
MYEDKTLICKECNNEFVFTTGEQEFYAEKGLLTNHNAANLAEMQEKQAQELLEKCTMLHVLSVVLLVRFRLSLKKIDLFIAVNVSQK